MHIPPDVTPVQALKAVVEFETIGALYRALSLKIQALEHGAQSEGRTIFVGDPSRQVVARQWFADPDQMFPIANLDDAVKGINVIIDQGEGTAKDPFDQEDQAAHYYRFEQIVEGEMLVHRPGESPPYAYGGDSVALDPSQVFDMDDDPKISKYKVGSYSCRMATQFSYSYTKLLRSLHATFNGEPSGIDRSMGVMYELRFSALQALETPAEWADKSDTSVKATGLSFEYVPVNAPPDAPESSAAQ